MDEAQVAAAIAKALAPMLATLKSLEEEVTRPKETPKAPDAPVAPSDKPDDNAPLIARLALLEKELEGKSLQEAKARFNDAIAKSLEAYEPKSAAIARDVLGLRFADATHSDNGYVLKSGKSLTEGVAEFLAADGASLLKATRQARGNDIQGEGQPPRVAGEALDLTSLVF